MPSASVTTRNVATFEKRSGVQIQHAWNLGDVSDAVRVLTRGNHHSLADAIDQTASRYEHTIKNMRAEAAALRAHGKGTD